MQDALLDKLIDLCSGPKRWIQLHQRIGPRHPLLQLALNKVANPLVTDLDEALDVTAVLANKLVPNIKYSHDFVGPGSSRCLTQQTGQPC